MRHLFNRILLLVTLVIISFVSTNSSLFAEQDANTLPTNGVVTSGSATISQTSNTMNVNQSSDKAVINWSTFNIGKSATVNFNQPNSSSSTLNRVNSASASMIEGALNANGKVIFINPNGIVFGKGADVNVGSIAATTMNIADKDFLSDNNKKTFYGSDQGTIVNQGTITANNIDGYIALMAPQVKNQGVVVANISGNNTIALVSGTQVTLTFAGEQLVNVNVDASVINSLIKNKHLIQTNGGQVIIAANAASDLRSSVLVNSGTISADGFNVQGGKIYLTAGKIKQSGVVTASATSNSSSKRVGGGSIVAKANTIELTAGSQTLARGDYAGGVIDFSAFKKVNVQANAVVDASAVVSGNGGSIRIDAPNVSIQGTLIAQGGKDQGNGGFIKVITSDFVTASSAIINAGSQIASSIAGVWTMSMPVINIDAMFANLISATLETTKVVLNALANVVYTLANSDLNNSALVRLLEGVVVYKTTSTRTSLELNSDGSIYLSGQVVANEGSLLDIVLSGTNTISANELVKLIASSVTIDSKQGEVELNGASITTDGGTINIAAKGDINLINLNVVANNPMDGGEIIIASSNGIVNLQQSYIQTNGGVGRGGTISITANQDVAVLNTNVLANGGENGGQVVIVSEGGDVNLNQDLIQTNGTSGRGGTIQIAALHNLILNATLQTNSQNLIAGTITFEADSILIQTNSILEAIGATGGGTVLVGGDWQGSGTLRQATFVTMNSGVVIDASALLQGNGGKIVLWSDITNPNSITIAYGTIYSNGGTISGNGGQIETSGYQLDSEGISVSAGANNGIGGLWLIDPTDSVITQATANSYINSLNSGTSVTNSVTGTMTVSGNIFATGNGTLTLVATGTITINAMIIIGGNLNITTNGLNGGADILLLNPASTVTINQSGTSTYSGSIGGGNVTVNMTSIAANLILSGSIGSSQGLFMQYYNDGYFADDLDWFKLNRSLDGLKRITTFADISNNVPSGSGFVYKADDFSYRWSGYFIPANTGLYYFKTTSDDSSSVYIGSNGQSLQDLMSTLDNTNGTTSTNRVTSNIGLHGIRTVTGSKSVTAGEVYPVTIYFGERGGGAVMQFRYSYNNSNPVDNSLNSLSSEFVTGRSTGSLTKNGSGTLTLSGASTYTGSTTISEGTLYITNAAGLGNA